MTYAASLPETRTSGVLAGKSAPTAVVTATTGRLSNRGRSRSCVSTVPQPVSFTNAAIRLSGAPGSTGR